jgi:branched-chain amino acid transport system permease protein
VISAFFTGLTGAAMGGYIGSVGPDGYTFYYSLISQIVPILGGIGSIVLGPMLGSILYNVFDEYLVYFAGARSLIMGLLLIVVIFFFPEGLVGMRKIFLGRKRGKSIGTT